MILAQFQSLYPEGSIISELVQIHHNKYIVRVNIEINGVTRVTGMAAAESIEVAEDRARERALMVLETTSSQNSSTNLSLQGQEVQVQSLYSDTTEKLDKVNVKQITTKQQTKESTMKIVNQSLVPEKPITQEPVTKESIAQKSSSQKSSSQELNTQELNTQELNTQELSTRLEPGSSKFVAQARDEDEPTTVGTASSHHGSRFTTKSDIPNPEINQPNFDSKGTGSNSQFQFDSPLPDSVINTSDNQADVNQLPLMSSTNVQSFMSPDSPSDGELEITASIEKKTTTSGRKKKKTEAKDAVQPKSLLDPIAEIDVEMRRLGWTREQGREHLIQTYGKRARSLLTDEQLLEFLEYLKSQPTPADPLDPGF